MAIIYITTNLINFKIYVGFYNGNNPKYLGSGDLLLKAIKKYGRNNFRKEILEEFDLDDWSFGNYKDRERYWIWFYNSQNINIGYNLTEGGKSNLGWKPTTQQRENMRIAAMRRNTNKNVRDAFRHNIEKYFASAENGRDHRNKVKIALNVPETRKKLKEAAIRRWQSPEYCKNHHEAMTSASTKTKQSAGISKYWSVPENIEKHRIRMRTPEIRKKRSINMSGKNNAMFGKHHTLESRIKIGINGSIARMGKKRGPYKVHLDKNLSCN